MTKKNILHWFISLIVDERKYNLEKNEFDHSLRFGRDNEI